MTDRLYYDDCYLLEFQARVVDADPERRRVYLDRTAFYPSSGGQPFDTGKLGGVDVLDVIDEEQRVVHVLSAPLAATDVTGSIHLLLASPRGPLRHFNSAHPKLLILR
ncbi:MAG: hypothetical protein LAP38_27945 [Acidobacteriia bacterium]|nr:hypothetical protein [Terriglobia bacterium]